MARRTARTQPESETYIPTLATRCPACDGPLRSDYQARRTVVTLDGPRRLRLQVRRCHSRGCERFGRPVRPEPEGALALPEHEFGLDVIALTGRLRHAQHRSVPEIHAELARRGVAICVRSITNLIDRYDELLALSCSDVARLRRITAEAGRVVLAIDGLQPDVGHEVLWVLRDALSGEVLLARSLPSSTRGDLARLIREVKEALPAPTVGVISDGQDSIRKAVKQALHGAPHQLCQFHCLREAAKPIYEADRHIKVQLKKHVRGVRPIERKVEGRGDDEAGDIRGYCAAVRSALTDDGRPPLEASGLKLQGRLSAIAEGLGRVARKRGCRQSRRDCGRCWRRAWWRPRRCGRMCGPPSVGSIGRRRSSPTTRGTMPPGCGAGIAA